MIIERSLFFKFALSKVASLLCKTLIQFFLFFDLMDPETYMIHIIFDGKFKERHCIRDFLCLCYRNHHRHKGVCKRKGSIYNSNWDEVSLICV